jgi:hypothetical protein
MADPITAGLAAAVSGATALFSYNKDAFVFEKTVKQAEMHQRQNMRVAEVALYREDIRDLFGLTTQKMDNYLIVNTLMLGFCISLMYGIELGPTAPDWIDWMWTLSMCGSILFLLLSIWLCLHASITAQSLVVRLLTQWLRLPVPNAKEISKYAADFRQYEQTSKNLLRMPLFGRQERSLSNIPEGVPDPHTDRYSLPRDVFHGIGDLGSPKLQKTHLQLFKELTMSWRGYDAYARVCMIMGTNQLLQALGHLAIARMFIVNQQLIVALFVVITMHSLSLMHFKLNINPSRRQHSMMLVFLGVPPIATFIASTMWFYGLRVESDIVAIFAVFIHLIWIVFVLTLAIEDDGGMPKNFTQVGLSTDIVGDDTFADYIDDKLDKIRSAVAASTSGDREASFVPDPVSTDIMSNPRATHPPIDPLELIAKRLHKLMRQWNSVTEGNLVLTSHEEKVRKRKIARRFDRLCVYVRDLPIDETTSDELADELRLLLDVKWNRMNSGYFINIDTGEIRVPGGAGDVNPVTNQAVAVTTRNPVEKFMDAIRRFRETDDGHHGEDHDSSDSSHDGRSTSSPVMSQTSAPTATNAHPEHVVIRMRESPSNSEDRDDEEETKSLLLQDSHVTHKLLKKQSTRPWTSYKQGSALLIICWTIALIMACLLPFGIQLGLPPGIAGPIHRGRTARNTGGGGDVELGGHDAGMPAAHLAARLNRVGGGR